MNINQIIKKIVSIVFIVYAGGAFSGAAKLDITSYQCTSKASHVKFLNGKIAYKYDFSIANKSEKNIYRLNIGEKNNNESDDAGISGAIQKEMTLITLNQPKGWQGQVWIYEEPVTMFMWNLADSARGSLAIADKFAIAKKSTIDGFSATSPVKLKNIFDTFCLVDGAGSAYYTFPVQNGDKVAPTGSVSANVKLMHSDHAHVDFKVEAKDNYDPLPQVTFEGIVETDSKGNPLSPLSLNPFGRGHEPIGHKANDHVHGHHPNKFKFHVHPSKEFYYKASYKITDATGNATTISTSFVIPKSK